MALKNNMKAPIKTSINREFHSRQERDSWRYKIFSNIRFSSKEAFSKVLKTSSSTLEVYKE